MLKADRLLLKKERKHNEMSTHELTAKIKELREMQQMIEEAQAIAEGIKDEIKEYMGEAEELRAGEYKVTYRAVTSCRIDTAALKKQHPDVAALYTKTTTTRRFCVA